jgi:peroxiredoxin
MPWIRLNPYGRIVPSVKLTTPEGERIAIADYRGRSNLILLFVDSPGRTGHQELIERCAEQGSQLQRFKARLLVILPSRDGLTDVRHEIASHDLVQLLLDPDGALQRRYAELVQREGDRSPMLFVLDQYGVPYAAWAGSDLATDDLCAEAMEWLQFIAIQCPE